MAASQRLWSGAMFIAIGGAAVVFGRDLEMGSATDMGPGYLPRLLGWLLAAIGLSCIAASLTRPGAAVGLFRARPLLIVTLATVLGGLLLERLGLPLAIFAAVMVASLAARDMRWDWRQPLFAVVLAALCTLVFVELLGLPLPVGGTWVGN